MTSAPATTALPLSRSILLRSVVPLGMALLSALALLSVPLRKRKRKSMNRYTALATLLLIVSAFLMLTGCTTPYDIGNADRQITPEETARNITAVQNRMVAWGGVIATGKNF